MTISNTANRASYSANSVTTSFTFAPPFFTQADLVVLTVDATGNTLTKMLTTDYTISGTQDASGAYPNGANVIFNVAPLTGLSIVIYRDPALTQLAAFVDNDPLPSATLNGALDKLTVLEQRSRDIVTRSLRQPDGDTTTINAIPPQAVRANGGLGSYAGYDAAGNSTTYVPAPAQASVSVPMAPVVTAATLALGRTAFGLGYGTYIQSDGSGNFTLLLGQGLENDGSGNLRVKLDTATDTVSGLLRSANGLRVDPSFARGYIAGFEQSAPGGAATMTWGPGVCADSTNAHLIKDTTAAFTKTLASWVAGSGNGGLDTGTTGGAATTAYFFHAIFNPTTGAVDRLISLSATAPTLPTGFTVFRCIGWWKTDGSKNWPQIAQRGDEFIYGVTILDVNAATVNATAALKPLTVPLGFQVNALFHGQSANASSTARMLFTSPDETDQTPVAGVASLVSQVTNVPVAGDFNKRTDTSGNVRLRGDVATNTVSIGTFGFIWSRGRNS